MKIGVLDIQGSVYEHFTALRRCGADAVLVKRREDFFGLDGLIIPGGESTTVGKLLKKFQLDKAIVASARKGMAIWGTCAGAILLAKKVLGGGGRADVENLGLMDIAVQRNGYGRQIDSFETEVEFGIVLTGGIDSRFRGNDNLHDNGLGIKKIPGIFIRAPKIVKIGKSVKILALHGKEIVAVRQGKMLATTFHPELTDDLTVHRFFMAMCERCIERTGK